MLITLCQAHSDNVLRRTILNPLSQSTGPDYSQLEEEQDDDDEDNDEEYEGEAQDVEQSEEDDEEEAQDDTNVHLKNEQSDDTIIEDN